MKVLVTGASGFIGNYVINELLKNNYSVIATSLDAGKAKKISWFNTATYRALDLSKMKEDIDYFKYFNSPDFVIHLAWEGLPNYQSLFHIEENLFRHYTFLKNLVVNGAKDITVTGTCLEYGLQEGKLNEESLTAPANSYAVAKDCLRKFLEQLQKQHPFDLKWARLFYMYGKGQNPNSILSQLQTALKRGDSEFKMSKGDQQRDYLPVETVAEYIVKIALQKNISGAINCCSGIPITINELVTTFLKNKNQSIKLLKGYYPYPDYGPLHFWGDNKKLKKILNKF